MSILGRPGARRQESFAQALTLGLTRLSTRAGNELRRGMQLGTARSRRTATALLLLLVPALAMVAPALGGHGIGTVEAAGLLLPFVLATVTTVAGVALVGLLYATTTPTPVRVLARAQQINAPAPSRVLRRGRPEQSRAPGCGH